MNVAVLIVGGGPVGLSTSIALSRFGVSNMLVERASHTSRHPKARGVNVRTMEIFRRWELEQEVLAAGIPRQDSLGLYFSESLASPHFNKVPFREATSGASPCTVGHCPQDVLEPLLLERARSNECADVRFGVEAFDPVPAPDGVTVSIRRTGDSARQQVRAGWLVVADGAEGGLRKALGIGVEGPGDLDESVSVLFEADLRAVVSDGRRSFIYLLTQEGRRVALMGVDDADRRWILGMPLGSETVPGGPTDPCWTDLIRRAVGIDDLAVNVVSVMPWKARCRLARTYRAGRALLAGDAAHVVPPTGGLGMNTGIADSDNLAWKLAGVIQGWADEALLDTYEQERRQTAQEASSVALELWRATARGAPPPDVDQEELTLRRPYSSGAFVVDESHRAPHVWLRRHGTRLSALDLFGPHFTLLAGSDGEAWRDAAKTCGADLRVPIAAHVIGEGGDVEDPDGLFEARYGVGPGGAVLVRPDGYLAWREPGPNRDRSDALSEAVLATTGSQAST